MHSGPFDDEIDGPGVGPKMSTAHGTGVLSSGRINSRNEACKFHKVLNVRYWCNLRTFQPDDAAYLTEKYITLTLVVLKRTGTSYFGEIKYRLDSNSCAQTPMDTQFWLWLLMLE